MVALADARRRFDIPREPLSKLVGGGLQDLEQTTYATFDDLLERVRAISDEDIESLSGDWTDYWSFGLGSAPVATALSRRAKRLLSAASTLSDSRPHPMASRAAELIDLYDEHTFAFWDTADDHPQTQTIETLKQSTRSFVM